MRCELSARKYFFFLIAFTANYDEMQLSYCAFLKALNSENLKLTKRALLVFRSNNH